MCLHIIQDSNISLVKINASLMNSIIIGGLNPFTDYIFQVCINHDLG